MIKLKNYVGVSVCLTLLSGQKVCARILEHKTDKDVYLAEYPFEVFFNPQVEAFQFIPWQIVNNDADAMITEISEEAFAACADITDSVFEKDWKKQSKQTVIETFDSPGIIH